MAGISPIDMITEPEAAALFTLRTMKDKGLKVFLQANLVNSAAFF